MASFQIPNWLFVIVVIISVVLGIIVAYLFFTLQHCRAEVQNSQCATPDLTP